MAEIDLVTNGSPVPVPASDGKRETTKECESQENINASPDDGEALPYYCRMICWERGSDDCKANIDTCEKRADHQAETEKDFLPIKYDPPKFAYDYPESAYHLNGTVG